MAVSQLIGYSNVGMAGIQATATRMLCPHGTLNANTVANEVMSYMAMRIAGTLDRGETYCHQNTADGPVVLTARLSGVDSAVTITIGAGQTGLFQDFVHSVAVVADDELVWKFVGGATTGNLNMKFVALRFTPTATGDCAWWAYTGGSGSSATGTSVTRFWAVAGTITSQPTTGAVGAITVRGSFLARNLVWHIGANNTRTTDTIMQTWIDGAAGNQIVTVGAGQTGIFEDVTHTDALTAGQVFCYASTVGAGSGGADTRWLQTTWISTARQFVYACASASGAGFDLADGVDGFAALEGNLAQWEPTDAITRTTAFAQTLSKLTTTFSASNTTQTVTVRTRIAGQDGLQAVAVGAGQTGTFEDVTQADTVADGQAVNYRIQMPTGTGAFTVRIVSLLAETPVSGAATGSLMQTLQAATVAGTATVVGSQFARPISDVADGNWTPSAGADLYACVDEAAASDADFISSVSGTASATLALAPIGPPGAGTVTVRVRAKAL